MSDSALIAAAKAGDDASFEALHRRHVLAAWGLAQAVTRDDVTALAAVRRAMPAVFAAISRGCYPPALGVRTAVLTATRAAAVSLLHGSTWTGRHQGRGIIDRAFSGLPECWRSALWLVEVERVAPIDAARPLRLPPDEAAALAARARACFKERYVRITAAGREPNCQATLRLLPRETAELAPHEVAHVDQHLAACRACRTSSIELTSLGPTLRTVALATPLLAMTPPRRARRETGRDSHRLVPALAAAVAVIFGLSSVAVIQRNESKPAEQVASPIDAAEPVRDPVTIRTLVAPHASVTAPVDTGPTAPPTVASPGSIGERQVVAAATQGSAVPAAFETPSAARTAETPAEPEADADPSGDGPVAGAPSAPDEGGQDPPAESTGEAQVTVEAAGAEASVSVDLESPTPVVVEIATPGPDTSLNTALAGSGA